MKKAYIDVTQKPTAEQIKMLERAEKLPVVPDDDCPELSEEDLLQFKKIPYEKRLLHNNLCSSPLNFNSIHQ